MRHGQTRNVLTACNSRAKARIRSPGLGIDIGRLAWRRQSLHETLRPELLQADATRVMRLRIKVGSAYHSRSSGSLFFGDRGIAELLTVEVALPSRQAESGKRVRECFVAMEVLLT